MLECSVHSVSLHVPIIPSLDPDGGPITITDSLQHQGKCALSIYVYCQNNGASSHPSSCPPLPLFLAPDFSHCTAPLHRTTAPHTIVQEVPVIPQTDMSYSPSVCGCELIQRVATLSPASYSRLDIRRGRRMLVHCLIPLHLVCSKWSLRLELHIIITILL